MISTTTFNANGVEIIEQKREQIQRYNANDNRRCIYHEYTTGGWIRVTISPEERKQQPKLALPTQGPFKIIAVHDNGTFKIQKNRYTERINIRCIRPSSHGKA
ncbi:TPA: hypothetical protein N0F65_005026 [Lagenidium giganteum]|uniref:Uncharacterized protein n=1 Tax=Lagenidium giganteum TaxID=4803 RepID=A0AAV2ZH22_9STRA|nr:TPA: hypothetical protein N0F65_005026 [Lagenidium giganteum]